MLPSHFMAPFIHHENESSITISRSLLGGGRHLPGDMGASSRIRNYD